MGTRGAGAATARHVVLVALEALLVAGLVWIAAMAMAGMSQSDGGITGSANAGRADARVTVAGGRLGGTSVVRVTPGGDRAWVHATCVRGDVTVLSQWARVDAKNRATLSFRSSPTWTNGAATCTAETGWFATNGRWRVQAATTFSVAGN